MRFFPLFFLVLFLSCATGLAETLSLEEMTAAPPAETEAAAPAVNPDRARMIDAIIEEAERVYNGTHGQARRAQNSGDIYVCKNYTVYLFRQTAGEYRMAAWPDVPLVIPNNQKKDDCAPYAYGVEWQDVPPEAGNPFVEAARFRYDENLSREENRELARAFLRQVQRGDYFQMSANYYYGVGAHSLVFIADYDPASDSVRWTDSNMKGMKKNGVRYGVVQYDAAEKIDWFVDAFCQKKRGATLYRLRGDIIPAP